MKRAQGANAAYAEHDEFHPDPESGVRFVSWQLPAVPKTPHWHHALEICCCLSGKGIFYFSDHEYELGAGDIMVVNHLERHGAEAAGEEPCHVLFIFFHVSTLERMDPQLIRPFLYNRQTFDNKIAAHEPAAQAIGGLMQQIGQEFRTRRTAHGQVTKALLHLICAHLLRHYGIQNEQAWRTNYNKYKTLEAGLAYIQSNYREPVALNDVARAMSLSASRTRHLFVELLGEGFQMYLIHYRIQQAQRLLMGSADSIESVCLRSGFQSTTSFYRNFTRIVGMSPAAYRETNTTGDAL